jgi:ElaB/YqjD/DUF883 family membrane-anchored ribosome-binding protein
MQLSENVGVARRELRDILDDMQHVVARVSLLDDAQIARLRSNLATSVRGVADRIDEGIRPARERMGALLSTADALVRGRPWTMTLAAVFVGFAVGARLRRRARSRRAKPTALVRARSANRRS